ncbi:tryptophan synthase subunit alpha [Yanghanlia caeni]|uniref:Tryptophan synthase alpha chain n=1 Tax=Yanghanlia caeni TaxID=3064283 RepID=A0ABU1D3L9_9BURK|nr:tryptophan synthase subunit alpha [Alcaligenaceae bacterium LG-2]HZH57668.1 tryptophan synthase subunit alpha [Burkholderiaceae bacterium]
MNASNERLSAAFARLSGRTALVPYITSGDPSIAATPKLMHALVRAGADIIELGVPFSDPMADGPVIQRAAERAIARGTGLRQVLEMVAQFRREDTTTPVVLMGYANPVERMGQQTFVDAAREAGVDGVLVVDYPPEEISEFAAMLHAARIDPIFLLAPTSTEARMKAVGEVARGYVYYVSLKGVTGAGHLDTDDVARRLEVIRRHVSVPVGVGFGIRDPQSAQRLSQCADAVVIGSKIIEIMEAAVKDAQQEGASQQDIDQRAIQAAADWLAGIRAVLD